MEVSKWINEVEERLRPLADLDRAKSMRAYMKDIAPFLGVPAVERRNAVKGLDLPSDQDFFEGCRALFELKEREFHYTAVDAIRKRSKKLPDTAFEEIEWFIVNSSWWDTVDDLARSVGNISSRHNLGDRLDNWARSENMWLRRTAILHQLGQREKTHKERLFWMCLANASDKEFFIRKAIGWALRDYGDSNPDAIREFVDTNRGLFSGLTIREATRKLG